MSNSNADTQALQGEWITIYEEFNGDVYNAAKVAEFFPRLNAPEYSNARVTDVNGRGVTISLGNKQVKPGYSFFVTTEPDEQTGEFYYKGSFVVRDAFEKASRADLNAELLDVYMKGIKPGDRVLMK